jgi:hypothetical protein
MPQNKRSLSRRPLGSTPAVVEFNPDYSNTKRDLKRIGLLAGSFFAILIVLSFFLR